MDRPDRAATLPVRSGDGTASQGHEETNKIIGAFRHRNQLAALGTAVLFVSQAEPFFSFRFGPWIDTIKGQVIRNHYFFSIKNGQVVGFCGWALTNEKSAQDWINNDRELSFEECRDGPCVLMMCSRALSKAVMHQQTRVVRAVHGSRRVAYWKRMTPQGTRLVTFNLQRPGIQRRPVEDIGWLGTA